MCLCGTQRTWLLTWWLLALINAILFDRFAFLDCDWLYRVYWNAYIAKSESDSPNVNPYVKKGTVNHKYQQGIVQ